MLAKKEKRRKRIKYRIRKQINGNAVRPRVSIYRSNKQIYCQAIDDNSSTTLVSASSTEVKSSGNKAEVAKEVGKLLASKLKDGGFETAVLDRNGYLYHGRVKALADGIREGGIQL